MRRAGSFFVKISPHYKFFLIHKKGCAMNHTRISGGQYTIQTTKTASLGETALAKIMNEIKDLYLWFAPESTEDAIRVRLLQHPRAFIDMLTSVNSEKCAGFSVYYTDVVDGTRVMFRGGTIVKDRSRGLYKTLLQKAISAEKPDFVVAMTQNPRVYEALRSFSPSGIAYPDKGRILPAELKNVVTAFCKVPGLSLDTMVIPGIYDSIRKDHDFKTATDPLVEKFFKETLGENDGFFVIIPLS